MQTERDLIKLYKNAHNCMRSIDGLQPQEALDELMKYLFVKQTYEEQYGHTKQLFSGQIKDYFKKFLKNSKVFSETIWQDYKIHLSNNCLEKIHKLFSNLNFNQISFDVRSSALAEFITPDIRKGLGIFLTPSPVVRMIINYVNPNIKSKILDPACGSGTFLIEVLKFLKNSKNKKTNTPFQIFGFDKNPKMLLLAKLNLSHIKNVTFDNKLIDSIKHSQEKAYNLIITNPPFGVSIDSRNYDFSFYKTCQDKYGYNLKTQTSEIVFMEKCLKLLKPNGTLAIVVPRSIITNNNLQNARVALSIYGYIKAIINLPPETFTLSGTQTATSILFIKKYKNKKESLEYLNVVIGNVFNTGYDSTGRKKNGEQLSLLPKLMKECLSSKETKENIYIKKNIRKNETFKEVSDFFTIHNVSKNKGSQLMSLCHKICIGKTPPRNAYSDRGAFILKVGNLTGSGINWTARERNYVLEGEIEKRKSSKKTLLVQKYDILLTAAA
ncbi:MAG: N-6 DNA methylase, partial [Oligoflexia bacterium]|nr:N-6 DNA methylase [Oligoflexia bacterium]